MWENAFKVLITALVAVAVAQIARRSTLWGAALASLPLVSVMAFVWLYLDTGDTARIAALSRGIFFLVVPSLALFVCLPMLLRAGWGFWPSLAASSAATAAAYLATLWLLARIGVRV